MLKFLLDAAFCKQLAQSPSIRCELFDWIGRQDVESTLLVLSMYRLFLSVTITNYAIALRAQVTHKAKVSQVHANRHE